MEKLLLMFIFLQATSVLKCPQEQRFGTLEREIQAEFDRKLVSFQETTNEQVAHAVTETLS